MYDRVTCLTHTCLTYGQTARQVDKYPMNGCPSPVSRDIQYALIVVLMGLTMATVAQTETAESVEVIQTEDGRVIYKYTDAAGNVAFQDRPPPEFFEVAPQEPGVIQPEVETVQKSGVPASQDKATYLPLILLVGAGLLLLAGLYVILAPGLQRWRRESTLERMLRKARMLSFTKVQLSSGTRSNVEIDRLVKTPAGILVLGEEQLSGTITGTNDSDTWQRAGRDDSIQMANPLVRVRYAENLVQELVGEVPTFGRVIYTGHARFVNGTPANLRSLSAFRKGLNYFMQDEVEASTLDAAWRRLMQFPRSNTEPLRILGSGWQGWIRRKWREALAGGLAGLALIFILVALFLLWDAN